MPIVSLPSVITNAPLSGACRATASRYIRKCMEISEWSFHSNRFDFVVLRNLVDHVLSLGDLSENGVDSVKVRLGRMTDEELAAAGVLPGVGHGQRPRDVLVDVLLGLALDGVAGPAGADASLPGLRNRVTTLNHEVRDHAVKLGAVIESRVREFLEVRDRAGHFVGEQLHVDSALRGLENGLFVRHHHSRERFSSTCATVFIPTITTDTASLSSTRSEEHTSELQSPCNLVCRLLLEKKKKVQSSQKFSSCLITTCGPTPPSQLFSRSVTAYMHHALASVAVRACGASAIPLRGVDRS